MSQYMNRPARKQAKTLAQTSTVSLEQAGAYNIWYGRWQGEGKRKQGFEKAQARCRLAKDAGSTRATPGCPVCVHFAHGCCVKGAECPYFHRTPTRKDRFDNTKDCFGREKWQEEREDMSGTGSFAKDQRTLYVGNIRADPEETEAVVRKHFGEWGDVERINVLKEKGVAFVTYKARANAEFAREAMVGQSLNNNEILNVRWAHEDPNPGVKNRKIVAAQRMVKRALDNNSNSNSNSNSNNTQEDTRRPTGKRKDVSLHTDGQRPAKKTRN